MCEWVRVWECMCVGVWWVCVVSCVGECVYGCVSGFECV